MTDMLVPPGLDAAVESLGDRFPESGGFVSGYVRVCEFGCRHVVIFCCLRDPILCKEFQIRFHSEPREIGGTYKPIVDQ